MASIWLKQRRWCDGHDWQRESSVSSVSAELRCCGPAHPSTHNDVGIEKDAKEIVGFGELDGTFDARTPPVQLDAVRGDELALRSRTGEATVACEEDGV